MSLLHRIFTPLALCATFVSWAGVTQYDYCPAPGVATSKWGTGSKEVYDVAMKVSSPSLVGKTVESVRIPFDATHVQGCKVWLSSQLSLVKDEQTGKKVNAPDILSLDAAVDEGRIEVKLPQPVAIPADGLWVGYSFEITDKTSGSDQSPVIVYPDEARRPGLWVHTSRRYLKWTDVGATAGCSSAMEVTIGGVPDAEAGLYEIDKCYVRPDSRAELPVFIANHGSQAISSIEYRYDVAGLEGTQTVQLPTPLPARFNLPVPLTLTLPMVDVTGYYDGTLTITKVNGTPNADVAPAAPFTLAVISFIPVKRPVMEEYTGLWCGYCPRGFACLEHMNDLYGDDFIGISYHSDDPMEIPGGVPGDVSSFPEARMDRTLSQDPDFSVINPLWQSMRTELPVAEVTPQAWWTDDAHTQIHAISTSRFVAGEDDDRYKVAYVLVQDGMQDSEWKQSNSYAGDTRYPGDPYMNPFTSGSNPVSGLVFNDIAVYSPALRGTPESIPTHFDAAQELTHAIDIQAEDVKNIYGKELIQDPAKLSVVAMLLDKDGKVVNAGRCPVAMEPASAASLEADTSSPVYYDLQGRRVVRPGSGIFIKVQGGRATKIVGK